MQVYCFNKLLNNELFDDSIQFMTDAVQFTGQWLPAVVHWAHCRSLMRIDN